MNSIVIVIIVFIGYVVAYHTYGKYLARKIFNLVATNKVPSEEFFDGVDYVPTKKNILFGHHFTTIAGLGPIVGPAIGIIWGWLPALLWVFFGSIFMGALHDFSTLIISARNKGKSIGDLTGVIIGPGPRYVFQFIMQLLLFIVLTVFALIVSTLFMLYPESVIPVWAQIPIAMWLGRQIQRGKSDLLYSIFSLVLMYGTIILGVYVPVDLSKLGLFQTLSQHGFVLNNLITVTWCIALFIYVFFASTMPVQKLLQPRDYINSHQLIVAILLMVIGIFIAHPAITAPAINHKAFAAGTDIPGMMPMLFIIIACGAISGFHSIASSGTTVKQLKNETDSLYIGYGGMLTESFLAVLVLLCVAAGLGIGLEKNGVLFTGTDAFYQHYSSWATTNSGIGAKLESFIIGAGNLFEFIGIPKEIGRPMIAVFIVSFANTTLDSATRMQRLSLQEIVSYKRSGNKKSFIENRYVATFFIVLFAAIMTFVKPGGKGALLLWPLFGALNQLLAGLGLALVSIFLYRKKKKFLLAFIPMVIVLILTIWAMVENLLGFISERNILLAIISILIIILTAWLLVGGLVSVIRNKHVNA